MNWGENGSTPTRPRSAALEFRVVDQEGLAEAAPIGEPDLAPAVEPRTGHVCERSEVERSPSYSRRPLGGVERLLALDQDEISGHPQVHHQGVAAVRGEQQVLTPAADPEIVRPLTCSLERSPGAPAATSAVEHLKPDPPPFQLRLELAGRPSQPQAAPASTEFYPDPELLVLRPRGCASK